VARNDEHAPDPPENVEAQAEGDRAGDSNILNPPDESDVARVLQNIDVVLANDQLRAKDAGVLHASEVTTEPRALRDVVHGSCFDAGEIMGLPATLEQLIGTERLAFFRQVALVPCDLGPLVPEMSPGDDVVVLVHGFMASAGVFRPLRARLEREAGVRVATFTHAPGAGVRRIARQLARLVDTLPRGGRMTIAGHSLGGVVARWFVQEMGGDARVAQTISLASPFHGVAVPPMLVGADVHERSDLLHRLRERAPACRVPHTSIVAGSDTIVAGTRTASLGVGDVVVLPNRGHNALLFDSEAADHVIDRVKQRGMRIPPPL
jgi:pimeloyl-ACP methyl ester carboxylesterase